ncbi:MAG: hypothetical protein HWE14_10560 [Flavobacteriia bacterium]|nr:hypothetical protein [Flavobacteriia bacterium]
MLMPVNRLFLLLLTCVFPLFVIGQNQGRRLDREFNRILRETQEVPTFNPEDLTGVKIIQVPMDFAMDNLQEQALRDELRKHYVIGITYIYTKYKTSPQFDQADLNRRRLQKLHDVADYLFFDDRIRWQVYEQIEPRERDIAKEQFHGFILYYTDMSRYSSFAEIREQLDSVNMLNYRAKEPEDTLIQAIFDRNPDWVRMNIHCDLTGSMSPYTAQLLMWFKMNLETNRILNFVFFNDGDDMHNSRKRPNRTGGIYTTSPSNMTELLETVQACMTGGAGGDVMENDIEALLKGIQSCRHCAEVILIADNLSPMRDYGLMNRIRRPVRVILCGTQLGINTQYLDLARETRGSVHTIDQDIYDLHRMRNGDSIEIDGETYTIRRGKFSNR